MILEYFNPDYRVKHLCDISPKWLKRNGYTKVVVDIDNTLLPRDKNMVGPRVMNWLRQCREMGITVALISNNHGSRIDGILRQTGCGGATRAAKPMPTAFKRLVKAMGGGKVLFVGDQIMTDVLGAKLAKQKVILCDSLGGKELWITRVNRKLEKFFLRRLANNNMLPKERVL